MERAGACYAPSFGPPTANPDLSEAEPVNHSHSLPSGIHTIRVYITSKMTTYIPSLTLPSAIFENAAISVLFPIVAGTAVGFSTQRKDNETAAVWNSKN